MCRTGRMLFVGGGGPIAGATAEQYLAWTVSPCFPGFSDGTTLVNAQVVAWKGPFHMDNFNLHLSLVQISERNKTPR